MSWEAAIVPKVITRGSKVATSFQRLAAELFRCFGKGMIECQEKIQRQTEATPTPLQKKGVRRFRLNLLGKDISTPL